MWNHRHQRAAVHEQLWNTWKATINVDHIKRFLTDWTGSGSCPVVAACCQGKQHQSASGQHSSDIWSLKSANIKVKQCCSQQHETRAETVCLSVCSVITWSHNFASTLNKHQEQRSRHFKKLSLTKPVWTFCKNVILTTNEMHVINVTKVKHFKIM